MKEQPMHESMDPIFTLRNGRLGWLLNKEFTPVGVVSGGDGDGENSEEEENEDGNDTGSKFSQDDLNRISAKEKRDGVKAGTRKAFEDLGFESAEDAKEFIERSRQNEEKNKDEQTRKEEAAAKAIKDGETAVTNALRKGHEADVMKVLLKTGADSGTVDDLIPMVKAQVGADAEEILEAVNTLKEKFPALFEVKSSEDNDDGTGKGTPDSNIGGSPKTNKKKGTAEERAASRFNRVFADKLPSKS